MRCSVGVRSSLDGARPPIRESSSRARSAQSGAPNSSKRARASSSIGRRCGSPLCPAEHATEHEARPGSLERERDVRPPRPPQHRGTRALRRDLPAAAHTMPLARCVSGPIHGASHDAVRLSNRRSTLAAPARRRTTRVPRPRRRGTPACPGRGRTSARRSPVRPRARRRRRRIAQRQLEEPFDLPGAAQVVELAAGRGLVGTVSRSARARSTSPGSDAR